MGLACLRVLSLLNKQCQILGMNMVHESAAWGKHMAVLVGTAVMTLMAASALPCLICVVVTHSAAQGEVKLCNIMMIVRQELWLHEPGRPLGTASITPTPQHLHVLPPLLKCMASHLLPGAGYCTVVCPEGPAASCKALREGPAHPFVRTAACSNIPQPQRLRRRATQRTILAASLKNNDYHIPSLLLSKGLASCACSSALTSRREVR